MGVCWMGTLPWMDLLEKKVQALTNSFLQSDVPEGSSLVLGVCFGGKWNPHTRAGPVYLQDAAA